MNSRRLASVLTLVLWSAAYLSPAQQPPRIQSFSPQGTTKKVRQVRVQFSEPMVSFGDPRATLAPFDIRCSERARPAGPIRRTGCMTLNGTFPPESQCEFQRKGRAQEPPRRRHHGTAPVPVFHRRARNTALLPL